MVNALEVAERRGKVTPEKSASFIRDLQSFRIAVDFEGINEVFGSVLEQARIYQSSAYDASYLELAQRRGLPLASKDGPLVRAARQLRIEIFLPDGGAPLLVS